MDSKKSKARDEKIELDEASLLINWQERYIKWVVLAFFVLFCALVSQEKMQTEVQGFTDIGFSGIDNFKEEV